jgi:hypothetical protein
MCMDVVWILGICNVTVGSRPLVRAVALRTALITFIGRATHLPHPEGWSQESTFMSERWGGGESCSDGQVISFEGRNVA